MPTNIVFCGIAPHPPLLIPDVGRERIKAVEDSQHALREFSRQLVATKPDTVVVISPHSPLDPDHFTARIARELSGDFSRFDAENVRLTFKNDIDLIAAVEEKSLQEGVRLLKLTRNYPLDHGALVPLYYLHEAGWNGLVAVFGFTYRSNEQHLAFGRAIAKAASLLNKRLAVVASGDLSHRLIAGGPYEYEPTAHLFDEQIIDAISRGDPEAVLQIDQGLRERAGECGYRSIVIALGCLGGDLRDHQVLSYEGPFGVGYMVAVLQKESLVPVG